MGPTRIYQLHLSDNKGTGPLLVPQEFVCPLSLQLMVDPVLIESGLTFEGSAIEVWFQDRKQHCPISGAHLRHTRSVPNQAVRQLISDWCHANGVPFQRGIHVKEGGGNGATFEASSSAEHLDRVVHFRLKVASPLEAKTSSASSSREDQGSLRPRLSTNQPILGQSDPNSSWDQESSDSDDSSVFSATMYTPDSPQVADPPQDKWDDAGTVSKGRNDKMSHLYEGNARGPGGKLSAADVSNGSLDEASKLYSGVRGANRHGHAIPRPGSMDLPKNSVLLASQVEQSSTNASTSSPNYSRRQGEGMGGGGGRHEGGQSQGGQGLLRQGGKTHVSQLALRDSTQIRRTASLHLHSDTFKEALANILLEDESDDDSTTPPPATQRRPHHRKSMDARMEGGDGAWLWKEALNKKMTASPSLGSGVPARKVPETERYQMKRLSSESLLGILVEEETETTNRGRGQGDGGRAAGLPGRFQGSNALARSGSMHAQGRPSIAVDSYYDSLEALKDGGAHPVRKSPNGLLRSASQKSGAAVGWKSMAVQNRQNGPASPKAAGVRGALDGPGVQRMVGSTFARGRQTGVADNSPRQGNLPGDGARRSYNLNRQRSLQPTTNSQDTRAVKGPQSFYAALDSFDQEGAGEQEQGLSPSRHSGRPSPNGASRPHAGQKQSPGAPLPPILRSRSMHIAQERPSRSGGSARSGVPPKSPLGDSGRTRGGQEMSHHSGESQHGQLAPNEMTRMSELSQRNLRMGLSAKASPGWEGAVTRSSPFLGSTEAQGIGNQQNALLRSASSGPLKKAEGSRYAAGSGEGEWSFMDIVNSLDEDNSPMERGCMLGVPEVHSRDSLGTANGVDRGRDVPARQYREGGATAATSCVSGGRSLHMSHDCRSPNTTRSDALQRRQRKEGGGNRLGAPQPSLEIWLEPAPGCPSAGSSQISRTAMGSGASPARLAHIKKSTSESSAPESELAWAMQTGGIPLADSPGRQTGRGPMQLRGAAGSSGFDRGIAPAHRPGERLPSSGLRKAKTVHAAEVLATLEQWEAEEEVDERGGSVRGGRRGPWNGGGGGDQTEAAVVSARSSSGPFEGPRRARRGPEELFSQGGGRTELPRGPEGQPGCPFGGIRENDDVGIP